MRNATEQTLYIYLHYRSLSKFGFQIKRARMSETNGMVTKLDKPRFFNRISLEVRMPRPNKNPDLLVLVYILFPAWKIEEFWQTIAGLRGPHSKFV